MLQSASQRAERHNLLAALIAEARRGRALTLAMVDARFADRRRQLALIADPATRAAAALQIAIEQMAEQNQLATQHRYSLRQLRQGLLTPLAKRHRSERTRRHARHRHQRAVLGVILQQMRPKPLQDRTAPAPRRLHITAASRLASRRSN